MRGRRPLPCKGDEGEIMRITSRSNGRIKDICRLISSGRFRNENGLFVIEGLRICTDAMQSNIKFRTLLVSDTALVKHKDAADELAKSAGEVITLPDSLFETLSDTKSPQGIMAVCEIPSHKYEIKQGAKYIALETLSDPANLGTIARTAEAVGIDALILSADSCDHYSPKALRAGMGSLFRLPVIIADNFTDYMEELKQNGFKIYAAVPDNSAKSVKETDFSGSAAVMIGNEGNGLSECAKALGTKVTIPMKGRAESLNAAAAASIIIWEML